MTGQELWDLLPGALRRRDEEAGGVLRAVVEVLAGPADVVARDIDALADDWFIETCADWVVSYLGDLVGVEELHPLGGAIGFSARARVADTIRTRRRKGTAAMLEDLARTTTGWSARAVEYFELLSTTQHVNHVRLGAPAMASVRDAETMAMVDGPFDRTAHTVSVRPLGAHRSGHNLPNIGLHVWPLDGYPLTRATAAPVADPPDGRWFVDPVGNDHAMAGPRVTETAIEHRAQPPNTPEPLRRRPLHEELDAHRADPGTVLEWFSPGDPAFTVYLQEDGDGLVEVDLDLLEVCDLSAWERPTGTMVRVDPVLGRVAVAAGRVVERAAVSWSYAFMADIGAGPYSRRPRPGEAVDTTVFDFQLGVSATDDPVPGEVVATLAEAVAAWHDWEATNAGRRVRNGRIVVMDSHRYVEDLTAAGDGAVTVAQGSRLVIVAARWPEPDGGGPRRPGAVDPAEVRPCLVGSLEVAGTGEGDRPGIVEIDGLLVTGSVTVTAPAATDDGLGALRLAHVTLVPAGGGLTVAAGNDRLAVEVRRSLCGPVRVAGEGSGVSIEDTVVHDPAAGTALDAPDAAVSLGGVTVLGATTARHLWADDTIFDDVVTVTRRQDGCVRFCWVPAGSATPRRYRCQPDLAVAALAPAPAPPGLEARLTPAYETTEIAEAAYARLAVHAAPELATGAESGAEMGAYRSVFTPQRLANLAAALDEYLPFGRVAAALPVLSHQGDQP